MDSPFKIDSEFSALIPAASADEVSRLSASVERDGILHPLVVWREERILLDGHTRYKLATKLDIPHPVKNLSFASRDEARAWVINHQLGRRNISDAARNYLLGKLYNQQKQNHGGDRRSSAHNGHLKSDGKTAEEFAKEHDVGVNTVRRAGKLAEAVNTLEEEAPGVAAAVLAGEAHASMKDITEAVKQPLKKRKKAAKAIAAGKKIEAELEPKHKSGKQTSDPRAWQRWDELFGKVKRAADDLNKAHPHANLCRKLHADLDVAFHTAKEWRRSLR